MGGDGWWEWQVDETDGGSATQRIGWWYNTVIFSSRNSKLWSMTLNFKLYHNVSRCNWMPSIGLRSFSRKVIVRHMDTHARPTTLPGPLKWSVTTQAVVSEPLWKKNKKKLRLLCSIWMFVLGYPQWYYDLKTQGFQDHGPKFLARIVKRASKFAGQNTAHKLVFICSFFYLVVEDDIHLINQFFSINLLANIQWQYIIHSTYWMLTGHQGKCSLTVR